MFKRGQIVTRNILAGMVGVGIFLAWNMPARATGERIECHCTASGEERLILSEASRSPYTVAALPVGHRFKFKAVLLNDPPEDAYIALYTYYNRQGEMVLLHQALYSYPPPLPSASSAHGFTGRQWVYEPRTEAEFHFWCHFQQEPATP